MSIPRPTSCIHIPAWNAELCRFPADAGDEWREPRMFTFTGGVCWPVPVARVQGVSVEGFACVVGYDVECERYYVFEQRKFLTVEHILGAGRKVELEGLSNWFNDAWARYRCRRYYHHQDYDTMARFLLQVGRSENIEPKPWLIDADWFDDKVALRIVWELLAMDKLWHRAGEQINQEINAVGGQRSAVLLETSPALHAVSVCLSGCEHSPWRKAPVLDFDAEEWEP